MRDLVVAAVCILLGALLLVWLIPTGVSAAGSTRSLALSPAFWPRILAVALALAGTGLAAQTLLRGSPVASGGSRPSDGAPGRGADLWRLGLAIGLLIPYYLACLWLGLLIPSIVAFVTYALLAGERNFLLVGAAGVLMPVLLTWFFIYAADVLIPLGPLWRLM